MLFKLWVLLLEKGYGMPTGVYIRTEKTIAKMSESHKRENLSKETLERMSIAHTGKNRTLREVRICERPECDNEFKVKMTSTKKYCSIDCANKNRKHKPHSEETKKKIGKSMEGKNKGTWEELYGVEGARKRRENHKGMTGKHHSEKAKRKIGKSRRKLWQNPEYREKQLKAIFAGYDLRPTKPERRLRNRLNHLFPNEYKYVGDGTFWIGCKNPDFININGQKKVIEMFGNYWHSKKVTGVSIKKHENCRVRHFAKYGFRTLIVWECELRRENRERLKEKLINFQNI